MKMVSQLTRRAMNRHRVLSVEEAPIPAPEPVRPLYAAPIVSPAAAPAPASVPSAALPPRPASSAAVMRPRTIYQQLMVNHDRMRERHLRGT